jgi:hypothetical protein
MVSNQKIQFPVKPYTPDLQLKALLIHNYLPMSAGRKYLLLPSFIKA